LVEAMRWHACWNDRLSLLVQPSRCVLFGWG
jgi:hypothetical protein